MDTTKAELEEYKRQFECYIESEAKRLRQEFADEKKIFIETLAQETQQVKLILVRSCAYCNASSFRV